MLFMWKFEQIKNQSKGFFSRSEKMRHVPMGYGSTFPEMYSKLMNSSNSWTSGKNEKQMFDERRSSVNFNIFQRIIRDF